MKVNPKKDTEVDSAQDTRQLFSFLPRQLMELHQYSKGLY